MRRIENLKELFSDSLDLFRRVKETEIYDELHHLQNALCQFIIFNS